VSLYGRIADLPLEVESSVLDRLELPTERFTRVTTVVRLGGAGEEGVGEDVTYHGELHDDIPVPPVLAGFRGTLDELSLEVDQVDLFREEPSLPAYRAYRRWAFEAAALDLALRQAGLSLADAVGRRPLPVRFVASMGLGDPPSVEPVRRWLDLYPALRFKLDPSSAWDAALVAALVELDAVATVDLKGAYRGTVVDQPADAELYRLVAEGFPDALIEDPNLEDDAQAAAALEPHHDRITWDAPIHSVADVESLPFAPRVLNVKPSRFGTVRRLFDLYDYAEERQIGLYGGGQWELGPGRGQIQYLASLFHPDSANDVAPGGYNRPPAPGLPTSPLEPAQHATGFRWG
jgi:L-alanine-DL-glutamate epimerase-like enolase superfamily enzyme